MSKQANTGYLISPIQQRVWRMAELDGSQRYWVQGAIRIEGQLNEMRLRQAVAAVVARHEVLRTSLQMLPGVSIPVQVVSAEQWETFAGEEKHPAWTNGGDVSADMSGGLILSLVRETDHCRWLRISAPSVCLDEISVNLLAQEIAKYYLQASLSSGEEEPLQYPDVSEWLNEAGQVEEAAIGRKFWRDLLAGFSGNLRSVQKETSPTFHIETLKLEVKNETVAQILAGESRGLWSTSSFFLSAWAVLLGKFKYQETPLIAVGVDGRSHEGLEKVIGPLTRYLPVNFEKTPTDCFIDLPLRATSALNQAAGWQECFFEEILEERKGGNAQTKYVPFVFDYLQIQKLPSDETVRFRLEELSGCAERFVMKLSCRRSEERLELCLHWDAGSCRREEAVGVAQSLGVILEQVAADPGKQLCDLIVVSPEQKKLLDQFNHTEAAYDEKNLIHEQFAAQVLLTPQAEAVRYEGNSLTYEELNQRAEALAAYLHSQGVKADSLVAICLERSLEMVIALLAVLKANAAYVPLDPGYPEARLEYMLRSSGVRWIVSTSEVEEKLRNMSGIELVVLDRRAEPDSVAARSEEVGKARSENSAYVISPQVLPEIPKGW